MNTYKLAQIIAKQKLENKKGASGNKMVTWALGILILIVLLGVIFSEDGIDSLTTSSIPSWALIIIPIAIVIGAIMWFFPENR